MWTEKIQDDGPVRCSVPHDTRGGIVYGFRTLGSRDYVGYGLGSVVEGRRGSESRARDSYQGRSGLGRVVGVGS